MAKNLSPLHPGEILREEFLRPAQISAYALAKATVMPESRVSAILNGKRAVTAETALRLARFFRTTPGFWLNLQKFYDLEVAERKVGKVVMREVKPRQGTKSGLHAP